MVFLLNALTTARLSKLFPLSFLILCLLCQSLKIFAQQSAESLKVLSYNIHAGNPPSRPGEVDLVGVARVINQSEADLVALQEVDVFTRRSGTDLDQASSLGKLTGRYHFFAKAIDHDGGEYGVAVLSKFPILAARRILLPIAQEGGEQRVMALIRVDAGDKGVLDFVVTHLDLLQENRQAQSRFILDFFKEWPRPLVLAGDFNASAEQEEIQLLDSRFFRSSIPNGWTFPAIEPKVELDYVFSYPKKRFKVIRHILMREAEVSDHLPLLVELR